MLRPMLIRRYLSVMAAQGFAEQSVLADTAIDTLRLDDPNYLIDMAPYCRLIDNMIGLTGDQGIGLEVGLARDLNDFGILAFAALACHTVRQSIEAFWARYAEPMGIMATLVIGPSADASTRVRIKSHAPSPASQRFFIEEALFYLTRVGAQISGTPLRLERLEFAYPAPEYHTRYAELFQCPIHFNQPHTCITLDSAWLEQPLKSADDELIALYARHLEQFQRHVQASSPTHGQLQSLLLRSGGQIPPLEQAAQQLQLSPRTLRRQLQQHGTSYRQVIEEFRRELAIEYLKSSRLCAKQISQRVGFDDVNAFRRAFKKWTGKTLLDYQASVAAGMTDPPGAWSGEPVAEP